jgi:hypothetical protein
LAVTLTVPYGGVPNATLADVMIPTSVLLVRRRPQKDSRCRTNEVRLRTEQGDERVMDIAATTMVAGRLYDPYQTE